MCALTSTVMRLCAACWLATSLVAAARAEAGSRLWLGYAPLAVADAAPYARAARALVGGTRSPPLDLARDELVRGLGGLTAPRQPCLPPDPAD